MWGAEGFVTRYCCGEWIPGLSELAQVSEIIIAVSYFAVSLSILCIWSTSRKNRLFSSEGGVLQASFPFGFAAVFLGCSITHALQVLAFHWPAYNTFAVITSVVAAVSLPAPVLFLLFHLRVITAVAEKHGSSEARAYAAEHELETIRDLYGSDRKDVGEQS